MRLVCIARYFLNVSFNVMRWSKYRNYASLSLSLVLSPPPPISLSLSLSLFVAVYVLVSLSLSLISPSICAHCNFPRLA